MTNKQLTVLISSLAVIAGGAAYWSTLTPVQRCFTEECRWAVERVESDRRQELLRQEAEQLERALDRSARGY